MAVVVELTQGYRSAARIPGFFYALKKGEASFTAPVSCGAKNILLPG
jgi:hypothetical protein